MNPIQKLLQSEINCLIERSKGFNAVQHNVTKGSLRETLLINFFEKLIPNALSISSGIICDCSGKSSTQTDFIVYDPKILPNLILDKNLAVIPVESVHLVAEIKTSLTIKDLKQVENSRAVLNSLKIATVPHLIDFKIPSIIIAFDCRISQKTLQEWMDKQNDVISICVIGKFCLSKMNLGTQIFKPDNTLPKHWETLNFSLQMFESLSKSLNERINIIPMWAPYLQGIEKFKELNNI
jgi:hypothetical protein